MNIDLEKSLSTLIKDALGENYPKDEFSGIGEISLEAPQDAAHGEISTNCALQLSKRLKQNPRLIAETIKKSLEANIGVSPLEGIISKLEIAGPGFINFFLSNEYFYGRVIQILKENDKFGKCCLGKNEKVQIEFVSANPTGPLSIAHARQAAVGDSLARIMDFCGFKVTREYYLNDEGNQINILGRSIELRLKELGGEKTDFPDDYYQGDYIREIAEEIKNGPDPIKNYSEYGVSRILDGIKKDLEDFAVHFDVWFSQAELTRAGKIEQAIDYLRKKGFIYEQDGAAWFKSTAFGDDKDRVVIKSDKSYTYLAPDIAYHRDKFQRGFSRVVNLWGPDHHGYIPRMKAAVLALGRDKDALSVIIVQLVTLLREGKPVRMSTRKACYVTLREIIDEIGKDAARFFLVARRVSSHLDFDLELAKKESAENPVYYIQYAFARISSILSKAEKEEKGLPDDLSPLTQPEELSLIRKLIQFPSVLESCVNFLDPCPLTQYLCELAAEFHKFYDKHRVLGLEDINLTRCRIGLVRASAIVLRNGLTLLGLSSPEKM